MKSERYDNGEIWFELHVSQSCILQTICTNDFMDRSTTNAVRHYSKLQSSREDTNNSEIKQSKTWYGQTQNAEVESSRWFWRIQSSLVLQSIGLSIRPKFESQQIRKKDWKQCFLFHSTIFRKCPVTHRSHHFVSSRESVGPFCGSSRFANLKTRTVP